MKFLITGYNGQLGYDIVRELKKRGYTDYLALDKDKMDITNKEGVNKIIKDYNPDVIFHCAAWTAVDKAEDMYDACYNVNVNGTVTDTTTVTVPSGGRYKCDDDFNIWKRLTPEDIDVLYEKFPNSGGLLIDAVYEDVKAKKTKVKSGLKYILGYAKNVGWDDNADHFDGGGMA